MMAPRALRLLALAAALAVPVAAPTGALADMGVKPGVMSGLSSKVLSPEARIVLAEFQLKDIHPASGLPDFGIVPLAHRPLIDARMFNIIIVNRARYVPRPPATTTGQAIDAWTSTVILGAPGGYGTSVDQWVAMAYMLGPS